jgi:hypothetical protein
MLPSQSAGSPRRASCSPWSLRVIRGLLFVPQGFHNSAYSLTSAILATINNQQRGVIVNVRHALAIIVALSAFGNIGDVGAAYDSTPSSSGSSDGCSGVSFSTFMPKPYSQTDNSIEVAPQSAFSFVASKSTFPKTITVMIKDESVPVTVTPHFDGFLVSGKIPASAKGTFVRIAITGKGPNLCERGDGWLLKVGK